MNGDPRAGAGAREAGAPAAAPGVVARGEIVPLLVRDGSVSEAQVLHAQRVGAKLPASRPLVPLLLELGLLEPQRLRATLHAHRLSLRIGSLLVELGHLKEADLQSALRIQEELADPDRKLGEVLVQHGFLGAQQLAEVLSSQLGVPCAPSGRLEVDLVLVARAPLELCRRHRFLPLRMQDERVCVAFADPLDKADAAASQAIFGAAVAPVIATSAAIEQAISDLDLGARVIADSAVGEDTAARTVREIVEAALREGASEVHVEPRAHRVLVRFRRDGILVPWRELPIALATHLVRRFEVEAGVEAEGGASGREGWLHVEQAGEARELRTSFFATAAGESVVLRFRDPHGRVLALDELGLLSSMRRRLEDEALSAPGGFFLIAGPSGSGRSATLHACLAAVAVPQARAILVEDALEVRLDAVSQNAIAPAVAPPLAERVRIALLQEPDVLALGALREPEDLSVALRAARYGPRVFGVLEAEDAVAALFLAVAAGSVSRQTPAALVGALAQRLVRRVCTECAEAAVPGAAELRRLGCTAVELAGGAFRRGRGCGRCRDTGYRGRIGVFELVIVDAAGRDHLRAGEDAAALRRAAAVTGPATLLEDGLIKAARGLTTLEEIVRMVPRTARLRPLAELERLVGEGRGA